MLREHLRRFWFRFEGDMSSLPAGTVLGCGVTAVDRADAEQLVRSTVLNGEPLPPVVDVVEDVDVRELDQGHVVPNMADPSVRGVWFPRLSRMWPALLAVEDDPRALMARPWARGHHHGSATDVRARHTRT